MRLIVDLCGDLERRVKRLEDHMADLKTAEQSLETSEAALEQRVTAHEAALKQTSADLQAQIDAIKSGADQSAVIASLTALKSRIDAFDPDAPAAPPPGP